MWGLWCGGGEDGWRKGGGVLVFRCHPQYTCLLSLTKAAAVLPLLLLALCVCILCFVCLCDLQLSPESAPKLTAVMQQHLLPTGTQSVKVCT